MRYTVVSIPRTLLAFLSLGLLLALAAGVPAGAAENPRPLADLRADTDRDGTASVSDTSDETDEEQWNATRGAVMLPNLDDDTDRCRERGENGNLLSDSLLAGCNDAADGRVNSRVDEEDLAPLRIKAWKGAPEGTDATLTVGEASRGKVRFFVERGGRFVALEKNRLEVGDLRRGARLGVEARDIVRDEREWNGFVNVTLAVEAGGREATDKVRMRVAPVIFQHDLMETNRLIYAPTGAKDDPSEATTEGAAIPLPQRAAGAEGALPEELEQALSKAASPEAEQTPGEEAYEEYVKLFNAGERDFARDLRSAVGEAGTPEGLQRLRDAEGDIWAQDYFEPSYASMPAEDGQQIVRIMVRSANAAPARKPGKVFLRDAGKSIFTELAGPDVGGVQQVDPAWAQRNGDQDTYNSTGNWGAIPPYETDGRSYPNGRLLFGSAPSNRPDPSFVRMMESQGAQPPVVMDTSWLAVGHVDEFLSFLPADNDRGWVLAVADPRGAMGLLREAKEAGNGDATMLNGLKELRFEERPDGSSSESLELAERTIDSVLASREVVAVNERAARNIDKNLARLRAETGLEDDEIVRVPVLFDTEKDEFSGLPPETPEAAKAIALLPDAVNGVHLSGGTFLAAEQHGPVIDGADIMEGAVEESFAEAGVEVRWVEDYYYAHMNGGEVHCTTNALRDLSGATPWWEKRP